MTPIRPQIAFALRFVKTRMVYRAAFWIDFLFGALVVFMQVFVWRALLGDGEASVVSVSEMTTYVALSQAIRGLTGSNAEFVIEQRLESGNICFDLVRPFSFRRQTTLTDAGRCVNSLLFHSIPSFILVALVFGVVPPASMTAALMSVVLVAGGVVVSFYLHYIVGLLSFYFLKASHLSWVFGNINRFLSGALVPIWFYPAWLARIADVAPFKFIYFTPISVYLGKATQPEMRTALATLSVWVVAFVVVESFMWRRAVRRLSVQGG